MIAGNQKKYGSLDYVNPILINVGFPDKLRAIDNHLKIVASDYHYEAKL
jgi:hypothetical protein